MHVTCKYEITNSKNGHLDVGTPAYDAVHPTDNEASNMPLLPPLNFPKWLNENQNLLQPPVNNFCIFQGGDFIVMAVGGPNERLDYHVNETEVYSQCLSDFCIDGFSFCIPRNGFINTKVECFFELWMNESFVIFVSRKARCSCSLVLTVYDLLFSMLNIFPANTPHNPVRFADTIGLVIERVRPEKSKGNVL
jgi:hypothetical protein